MKSFAAQLTLDLNGNLLVKLKDLQGVLKLADKSQVKSIATNKRFSNATKKSSSTVASLGRNTKRTRDALGRFTKNTNRSRDALGKFTKQGNKTRSMMRGLGGMAGGIGGIIGGGMLVRSIANLTGQWKTGLAKVSTLTEGGLGEVEAKYGKAFKNIAVMSGQNVGIVLEASYQALSADVKESKLVPFMKIASKAAVSGFTDMTTAVDGLTSVTNAWGMSAEKAANIFLLTQNLGKTTFGEISGSIGGIGAQAKDLKISFAEVGASIAGVTSLGGTGAEAVTGLKSVLKALSKPTREQSDAFKELGITLNTDTIRNQGFRKTMISLTQSIKASNLPLAEQDKLLSQIFGRQEAITFIKKFTSPKGLEKSAELLKQNAQGVDVLEGNFKKMEKTMAFKRAKVRLQNLAITIGSKMAPAMEKFAIWAGKGIEKLEKWILSNPALLKDLGNLAKALANIAIIAGKTLLPVVKSIASVLSPLLSTVAKFLSSNPSLIKALIGAAVAGKVISGMRGMGGVGGVGGGSIGGVVGAAIFATTAGIAMVKSMQALQKHQEKAEAKTQAHREWQKNNSAMRAINLAGKQKGGGISEAVAQLMKESLIGGGKTGASQMVYGAQIGTIFQKLQKGEITQKSAKAQLTVLAPTSIKSLQDGFKSGIIKYSDAKAGILAALWKRDINKRGGRNVAKGYRATSARNREAQGLLADGSGPGFFGKLQEKGKLKAGIDPLINDLRVNFAGPLVKSGKDVVNTFLDIFGLGKKTKDGAKKGGGGGGGGIILGKKTSLTSANIKQTNIVKPITTINIDVTLKDEVDVNTIGKEIADNAEAQMKKVNQNLKRLQGI